MTDPLAFAAFADPVRDGQACFRAVLDAMARPGTIHAVSAPAAAPPPLHRATAAVLLALCDAETPLWLDAAAAAALPWLTFHTGAPLAEVGAAAFAVALSPVPLATLAAGTDDAPEGGATLVLQLPALGQGRHYRLSSPGLAAPAVLPVAGLPDGFAAEWAANRARFPRGIDLVLCAGDTLAALPRTVAVEAL